MALPPSLDAARIRLRRGGEHVTALANLEAEVCDGFLRKIECELPDRIPAERFMSVLAAVLPLGSFMGTRPLHLTELDP